MAIRPLFSAASILALSTAPALADLTPAEVWADWQDLATRNGAVVETAAVDEAGGNVTARDLVLRLELPEDGSMAMDLGDVSFRALGDGRVAVDLAERIPITMEVPSESGGGMATVSMAMTQSGMQIVVSGDASARVYDYEAQSLGVADLQIDDPAMEEKEVEVSIDAALSSLTGQTSLSGEEVLDFDTSFDAETFQIDVQGSGVDEMGQPADFRMNAEVRGVTERSSGQFTSFESDDSPAAMVQAGLAYEGSIGYGAAAYDISGEGPDGPFQFTGTAENGSLDVALGPSGLSYVSTTGPQTVQITGGEVPFPLSLSIAETGGEVTFPIVPGDEVQSFALSSRMIDLTLDETIWNMLDPSEQVPRDPATVVIDLTGEVILTEDIFDPAYAENPETPPGSIENVALNELRIEVAGAALSGTGDFEFVQTGMMPQPVGQVDLILTGGNALIDTLVGLGALPPEQAMGARMMLGLFARPGEGEDELLSTIEIREDGAILANGQRIQ